ncbi:MAG: glycosyltransferase family 4 protein [Selenomonadaceae bacterium]
MKILYDQQAFCGQSYGGVSRYFFEIIQKIAETEDCEIDLYKGFNMNKYEFVAPKELFHKYFSKGKLNLPKSGRVYNWINQIGLFTFSAMSKYDIYHPTYYNNSLFAGQPNMVVTVHDMIHEIFAQEFYGDTTTLQKRNIVKQANGIITVSENTKKDLMQLFNIDEEKIKVIYLANSLNHVVEDSAIIKDSYILYVGNRNGYKNFDLLAKSFAYSHLYKDFMLVSFGGGDFSKKEKETFEKLKIIDRVFYCEGKDEILANLYKYATAFVYPSQYEGFGIPPLEAMHYGTPVIASAAASIPEVVGNAALTFDPKSIDDLIDKLGSLLNDSKLYNELKVKGSIQEKKFSWEKCAKETYKYYQEIAL